MKLLTPTELLKIAEELSHGDSYVYYTGAFARDISFAKPELRIELWKLREAAQTLEAAKLIATPSAKRAKMLTDYIMQRLDTGVPPGVRFAIQRLEDKVITGKIY